MHRHPSTNPLQPRARRKSRLAAAVALAALLLGSAQARIWTNSDGSKTFEGELKSYDPPTGAVGVTLANGTPLKFNQEKLSAADIAFLKEQCKGLMNNEWMSIKGGTIGPEYGIGHPVANAIDAPVMILQSCIGNRSLGWDLLPPGSEPYEFEGKMSPGYRGTKEDPKGNGGMVLDAQLAVDGASGKHPGFKGNVATVYANPLSKGGSGNSHYGGNSETYMEVGEAMGKAMAELLKN